MISARCQNGLRSSSVRSLSVFDIEISFDGQAYVFWHHHSVTFVTPIPFDSFPGPNIYIGASEQSCQWNAEYAPSPCKETIQALTF